MTKHYVCMDGLRGVAALAIVVLHAAQIFKLTYPTHAYLAVDFFFCLSGFVMGHAYEAAFSEGRMTFGQFLARRLIRLYPMVLVGVLLGAFVLTASLILRNEPSLLEIAFLSLGAASLLPLGLFIGHEAFALNNPLWSLSFELVANAVYGILPKGPKSAGLDFALLALFAVSMVSLIHYFGWLAPIGFSSWDSYFGGFIRVAYPFFAGVLIFRYRGASVKPAVKFAIPLLLLCGVMFLPYWDVSWIYDSIAILIVIPLIVSLSEKSDITRSRLFWAFLGRLSYPLYVVHLPVVQVMGYLQILSHGLIPAWAALILSVVAAGIMAALVLILVDDPIRAYVRQRRLTVSGRALAR